MYAKQVCKERFAIFLGIQQYTICHKFSANAKGYSKKKKYGGDDRKIF